MADSLVRLRPGTASDLNEVAAVMGRAFEPRYGEAWTGPQCLGVLSLPGVWLTLADCGGPVAGFALARLIVDEVELLLLATDPDWRGRGVGRALLRSVLAEAGLRDARVVHLEVRANNPAVQLYRSSGFGKVGERRNYYRGSMGQQYDAHSYAVTLGG